MTSEEALALLTPTEILVTKTLADSGGSSKETAFKLGISRNTIRHHRSNINAKLGTSSISEVWVVLGYLRLPPERR